MQSERVSILFLERIFGILWNRISVDNLDLDLELCIDENGVFGLDWIGMRSLWFVECIFLLHNHFGTNKLENKIDLRKSRPAKFYELGHRIGELNRILGEIRENI